MFQDEPLAHIISKPFRPQWYDRKSSTYQIFSKALFHMGMLRTGIQNACFKSNFKLFRIQSKNKKRSDWGIIKVVTYEIAFSMLIGLEISLHTLYD